MHKFESKAFYDLISDEFTRTRQNPWSGWSSLLDLLPENPNLRVLDLGCGNGRFYDFLIKNTSASLDYTGIDHSQKLLDMATKKYKNARFINEDIFNLSQSTIGLTSLGYDLVVCFGLMHHLAKEGVNALLEMLMTIVNTDGVLVLTFWQFNITKNVNHLAKENGIKLGEGDYLLKWNNRADTLRYCHKFSSEELELIIHILRTNKIVLKKRFFSDGKDGKSNLYLIFKKELS